MTPTLSLYLVSMVDGAFNNSSNLLGILWKGNGRWRDGNIEVVWFDGRYLVKELVLKGNERLVVSNGGQ